MMCCMESRNALPDTYLFPDKVRVPVKLRPRLVQAVWEELVFGRFDQRELTDIAQQSINDVHQLSEADAHIVIKSLLTCRRAQINKFKETGDFADMRRLNQAFFELTEAGVLSLADYLCCTQCASDSAYEEMYRGNYKAVLYFHHQDTERLLQQNATLLGFDYNHQHYYTDDDYSAMSTEQKQAAFSSHMMEIVQETIKPIFAKYNIGFEWNGDTRDKMLIKNVDWLVLLPNK